MLGGDISLVGLLSTNTVMGFKGVSLPAKSLRITLIECSESSSSSKVSQIYVKGSFSMVETKSSFIERRTSPIALLSEALTII